MIFGVGVDIISVIRVRALFEKFPNRFINRILTEKEKSLFIQKGFSIAYLAKRYAAKEAVSKALGCGIGANLKFHDIEVLNSANGSPVVKIHSEKFSDIIVHLSISDEKEYAIAYAHAVACK
jgi:holo-[acyl-carrier protein] synthase